MRVLSIFVLSIVCGLSPKLCAASSVHPLGRFAARGDSLGYDEYRSLPADEQLNLRSDARRWLRRSESAGSLAEALDLCATSLGHCPYFASAWMRYAELHHGMGRYDIAQYCLQQVDRTLRFEARESERAGVEEDWRVMSAEVAYNLGQLALCVEQVDEALKLREDDGELLLLKARALGDLGEYASARAILRGFARDEPSYAHSLHVLGNVEMVSGRLNASEDAFARAAKYGRRGPIFLNDRGRLELARDDAERAERFFRQARDLLPDFMEARCNLAISYRRQGRLDLAIEELESIILEQPSYAAAQFQLAESYRRLWSQEDGDYGEKALQHYGAALAGGHNPGLTTQRRAELSLLLDRLGEAEQDLLSITEDPTVDPSVVHLLARVKKDQGELRIAAQLLEMARSRGLDSAALYSDIGEVHLREGRLPEAVSALNMAVERNDQLITTRVNLSIAHAMLGDLDAADRVLRDAELIQADHPRVVAQRAALSVDGESSPD